MTVLLNASPPVVTLGDLLERLGGIAPERVRYWPLPGTATEQDVIDIEQRENRLCELVDGVLVEKPMGFRESLLAVAIISALEEFISARNLGIVAGADGMMRLARGLVRIPDVSFISWAHLPHGVPSDPIPGLAPDLAVEVLSASNTPAEMERKRREYFTAGVRLVWLVDPRTRTVAVYTGPEDPTMLRAGDTLDGGAVVPGFKLEVARIFAKLDAKPTR